MIRVLILVLGISGATGSASFAGCSSFVFAAGKQHCFAANFDFPAHFESGFVFVNPRGLTRHGWSPNIGGGYQPTPEIERFRWTSRYGNVMMTCATYGMAQAGINEKGLCIMSLQLLETKVPSADNRVVLADGIFQQYILDQCATIDDIETVLDEFAIETVNHFHVVDRNGDTMLIEFINGELCTTRGRSRENQVLTNSTLKRSLNAYHDPSTIGTEDPNRSLARFCTLKRILDNETVEEGRMVEFAFSTLEQAKNTSPTLWRIVFDPIGLKLHYQTLNTPLVRTLDLADLNFNSLTTVKMVEILNDANGSLKLELEPFKSETVLDNWKRFVPAYIALYGLPQLPNAKEWCERSFDHLTTAIDDDQNQSGRTRR